MSTITTIASGDLISTSRTDINTNFSNLNTDKIETSYLDTDTTLAANSDSKIATQKATKAYVLANVNPTGASWNEYAADAGSTDAYVITLTGVAAYATGQTFKFKANTANTGAATLKVNSLTAIAIKKDVTTDLATGDILANQIVTVIYDGTNMQLVDRSGLNPTPTTVLTLVPKPVAGLSPAAAATGIMRDLSVATVMHVAQIDVPYRIVANKVSVRTGTISGTSTVIDITLYSEDGQTKTVLVADGTIDGTDDDVVKTFTITETTIVAGRYYLACNIINASGGMLAFWETDSIPFSATAGLSGDVTSEPVLEGTVAISSGVPATTITPGSITEAVNSCLIVRFDN